MYVIILFHVHVLIFFLKAKKPEKIDPEYAIPEDKPSKCAADQKTSDTGVYVDIQVEESDHPLPCVSDDNKVTYSKPLFEKVVCLPSNDLSKPTSKNETKFDEQDFDEKDVEVCFHKPCVDSDEEVPPVHLLEER